MQDVIHVPVQDQGNNFSARKPKKIWLILFSFLTLLILAGIGSVFYVYYQVFSPADFAEAEFVAQKGEGVKEIAAHLEEQGFIHNAFWFETYVWYKKEGSSLQAGKYLLLPGMNIPDIMDALAGGKYLSDEISVTFPEGFDLAQIKGRLAESNLGANGLDHLTAGDFKIQYKFLDDTPDQKTLEGFLFPDTYRFKKEITDIDIVKRFLDNFDKKLTPQMKAAISEQDREIYEVMILASIVQQESQSESEMKAVAGVFTNRLRIGMALQSDATVNYATGKSLRQPTADDITVQSPYNTYINKGLPPGPICNPGIAAIEAAIWPDQSDYFYFLHPLNSPAVFSKTLDEHNKNKAKYLK